MFETLQPDDDELSGLCKQQLNFYVESLWEVEFKLNRPHPCDLPAIAPSNQISQRAKNNLEF